MPAPSYLTRLEKPRRIAQNIELVTPDRFDTSGDINLTVRPTQRAAGDLPRRIVTVDRYRLTMFIVRRAGVAVAHRQVRKNRRTDGTPRLAQLAETTHGWTSSSTVKPVPGKTGRHGSPPKLTWADWRKGRPTYPPWMALGKRHERFRGSHRLRGDASGATHRVSTRRSNCRCPLRSEVRGFVFSHTPEPAEQEEHNTSKTGLQTKV
jgi:hypothetical protein